MNSLPITAHTLREVSACTSDVDWLAACSRLRREPYAWLLDTTLPNSELGRFSMAGSDPYLVMRAFGRRVELEWRRGVTGVEPKLQQLDADPFSLLRRLLPPPPRDVSVSELPFLAGAVGYFGYELAQQIETLELEARDELDLPDLELLFNDRVLVFDHNSGRLFASGLGFGTDPAHAARRAQQAANELSQEIEASRKQAASPSSGMAGEVSGHFSAEDYADAVRCVKREIAAGEVYQACLTQRLELAYSGEAWPLYERLRAINPAPFAAYLELPEVTLLSSSPERFLKLSPDRSVEARPIKGTRPLGAGEAERIRNRRDLARSHKDRAENVMIVDLMRNDLGRVCEPGSVVVPELFRIEPYATLYQLVSTVRGRLRRDCDAIDLLRAAFPPGSMTGAPKIAAMRLLDRLEPVRRGVYSGALGYLDVRGGLDLSVVIRTILLRGGRAYLHVGGGIVADSDPYEEFQESMDKAAALLVALRGTANPTPGVGKWSGPHE